MGAYAPDATCIATPLGRHHKCTYRQSGSHWVSQQCTNACISARKACLIRDHSTARNSWRCSCKKRDREIAGGRHNAKMTDDIALHYIKTLYSGWSQSNFKEQIQTWCRHWLMFHADMQRHCTKVNLRVPAKSYKAGYFSGRMSSLLNDVLKCRDICRRRCAHVYTPVSLLYLDQL